MGYCRSCHSSQTILSYCFFLASSWMVFKLSHKQSPRLDKGFHPVGIASEKGRPSRMCPWPIIIHYLHKYNWTEIPNSNLNFYADTFRYFTAPKQQLCCCAAGLWLTESLSSSVAVVDWLKRLNPSLSFASDSYKPQSVQIMEFTVTKWASWLSSWFCSPVMFL